MSSQDNFNIDGMETIPNHIKRYIQHLYEKKQPASVLPTPSPAFTPTIKMQSKSLININVEQFQEKKVSRTQSIQSSNNPKLSKVEMTTLLANQYLRELYKSIELPKTLTTHASTNFSIQEVPQETQITSESDFDPDELISQINVAAKKIVNQIQIVINKHPTDRINLKKPFHIRQKQYEENKSRKMNRIKTEIEQSQKQCTFMPKTNSNKRDLVTKYINRQLHNGKASNQLKNQNKCSQTYQSFRNADKRNPLIIDSNLKDRKNSREDSEKKISESATQTEQNENINTQKLQENSKVENDDFYVPLWERVEFILKKRQQKVNDQAQLNQQRQEEFYNSFMGNSNKSISKSKINEFVNDQNKWKEQKEDRILQQRINIKDDCTFQPSISKKSKSLASKLNERQPSRRYICKQANGYSFTPKISKKSLDLVRNMSMDDQLFSTCKYTESRQKLKQERKCDCLFTSIL